MNEKPTVNATCTAKGFDLESPCGIVHAFSTALVLLHGWKLDASYSSLDQGLLLILNIDKTSKCLPKEYVMACPRSEISIGDRQRALHRQR